MAILTFEQCEGLIEEYGDADAYLAYGQAFGKGQGWVLPAEAEAKILRIRDVKPGEAGPLCAFLLRAGVLSEFRLRMASEDWALLLDALPDPVTEPEGAEA
jgi:hypothetical protein